MRRRSERRDSVRRRSERRDSVRRRRDEIMPVLEKTYGAAEAARWFRRWRIFFLACAELFNYRNGEEWLVGHYRFRHR